AADAAFVTTTTAVGTASGLAIGAGLAPDDPRIALWAGLSGQLTGLALGTSLQRVHPGTVADDLEAVGMGAAMGVALAGALQVGAANGLPDPDARNPLLLGAGIGLAGGTLLGHLVAPRVRMERNDWALVLLATGTGAALGQFAPLADNQRGALPAVGASTGLLFGYALAGSIDPDWDALGSGGAGAVFGGLVLGGAALWVAPEQREIVGAAVLLGGISGMGLGGLLADVDQDPIDDRDVVLAALAAGWTGAHVLALNNRATGDVLSQPGPLLVLPAAGAAVVSGLAPVVDVPITHSMAGLTLGLWGTYLGATAGALAFDDPVLVGMIGGDVGAIVGTVVLSPVVGLTPTTVALADGGGILGGATGLVTARAFTRDPDMLLVGSIVGATSGFLAGGLVGRQLRLSGRTRNIALRLPDGLRVAVVPSGAGATLQVSGW
ncbi:MAG: hypothetical protein KC656_26395, partial [Myxococcales bacterium]|nr:hypothetical protein [Myxococcales bacterium]